MSDAIRITPASWARDAERAAMIEIRRAVFVVEQQVPVEIELDGSDAGCAHWLAFDAAGEPIGTARMQQSGHLGRIAVIAAWRGRGIGARLVEAIVEHARASGLARVDLNAQSHAIGFYEKLGFELNGEEFMEAGIPHRNMQRALRGPVGDAATAR